MRWRIAGRTRQRSNAGWTAAFCSPCCTETANGCPLARDPSHEYLTDLTAEAGMGWFSPSDGDTQERPGPCRSCNGWGTGTGDDSTCWSCDGTGKGTQTRTYRNCYLCNGEKKLKSGVKLTAEQLMFLGRPWAGHLFGPDIDRYSKGGECCPACRGEGGGWTPWR